MNVDDLPTKTFSDALASANSDQLPEGAVNLYLTGAERTKLGEIEALAEVNNISDANATDLTDGGDTTLHTHTVDLGSSAGATSVDVTNTAGTNATIPAATDTLAGLMLPAEKTSLADLVSGILTLQSVPASPTSTGTAGMISADASYFYICTATDTWKRIAVDGSWV